MGISSGVAVHAGHRDGADRRHDPRKTAAERGTWNRVLRGGLIAWLLLAGPAGAETLRFATYHAELTRRGPGLLLRDLSSGEDAQIAAVVAVIAAARADVLLLMGVDYDLDGVALSALADRLAAAGAEYPVQVAVRPNTGRTAGVDLNGDGRCCGPGDSQGYGRFAGAGGMAVLSRLPLAASGLIDLSAMPWHDLPGAILPPDTPLVQRLSTTGHWIVPLALPGGQQVSLLAWHAGPPVFDGPEDRNGRRNHDETALWLRLLEGGLDVPAPAPPFVILGGANLDPARGEGRRAALAALLSGPWVQDPLADGLPTADFSARDGPGWLRVDYVLPSADLTVADSGVLAPPSGEPLADAVRRASRHRLVWVDVVLP